MPFRIVFMLHPSSLGPTQRTTDSAQIRPCIDDSTARPGAAHSGTAGTATPPPRNAAPAIGPAVLQPLPAALLGCRFDGVEQPRQPDRELEIRHGARAGFNVPGKKRVSF